MATLSLLSHLLLLINTLVLDQVFYDALYRASVLEPMPTETHLQPRQVAPTLQLLLLDANALDLRKPGPVLYDLSPQGAVRSEERRVGKECVP